MIEKGVEIFAQAPKGLDDAWQDSLPLRDWVPSPFVVLSNIGSPARVGKGALRVPLGQRVANGGVDKELLTSGCNGEDVHDGVL